MGFITMLSREAGTIAYGTRMVEQDRINLSVQVDLGNCSAVYYMTVNEITGITDGVIWFEDYFYIPTGVTEFSFVDDGVIHVWTWNVGTSEWDETTFTAVEYAPSPGPITEISDGVTHNGTHFIVPTGVTAFTFEDDGVEWEATFSEGTWSFAEVVPTTEVAYTAAGDITETTEGVTYNGTHFVIPEGVTEFDFRDDGIQKSGLYDGVGETWEWLHLLGSTDGTGDGESQTWLIRLPVGQTMNWHWGDGTTEVVEGQGTSNPGTITLTNDYTEPAAEGETYDIKVSGDYAGMSFINCSNNGLTVEGNQYSVFTLSQLYIDQNNITGNGDRLGTALSNAIYFYFRGTPNFEINCSTLAQMTNCGNMLGNRSIGTRGRVDGDASLLRALPSGMTLNLSFNSEIGLTFESTTAWNKDGANINLSYCNMSSQDVDNALIAFAGDGTDFVQNSTLDLRNNAVRTSASDAAVAAINDDRGNTLHLPT